VAEQTLDLARINQTIRLRRSGPDLGRPLNVTMSFSGDRWFASICYERPRMATPVHPRMADLREGDDSAALGADYGVVTSWTVTEGVEGFRKVQLRQATGGDMRQDARLQRSAARCTPGSRMHRKRLETLRRRHAARARRRREDTRHLVQDITDRHALAVVEDLNIPGMTARPRDRSGAPNGRSRKKGMNRRLLDGTYGAAVKQLEHRAKRTGTVVLKINPAYTSQECRNCGHTASVNRKSQAVFQCVECDHWAEADENACHVIRTRGLIQGGYRGADYRPSVDWSTSSPRDTRRPKTSGEPGASRDLALNPEPARGPDARERDAA
jgi:putative transposase